MWTETRRRYRPPPVTPPLLLRGRIPKGVAGTRRTLALMSRLIHAGVRDFYVRQAAIDILLEAGVAPKDYLGEINALFRWVQRNVRYTKDPFRLELLHTPRRMLQLRSGDCDDMTILLASMLEATGHPVRLVVAGYLPGRPDLFSHVYLEVNYRGRWIPLDPTMDHGLGWEAPAAVRLAVPLHGQRSPPMRIHYRRRRRLVPVGRLMGLLYQAPGPDGRPRRYIHFVERPAQLAAPEGGGPLRIYGNLRVTPDGIEG